MIRDWDIVTSYVDSVTTSLKTVTFPKVQEQVKVKNQGNANLTYTIGSQSGTLTPGQSVTVNEDISSFTIQAASGTQAFELRAKEKGTEQTETETDVMSLLAEKATQSYVDAKIGNIGNTKIFKGSIAFASLPTNGNANGDYYYVTDKASNYCWNGNSWVDIGNNLKIADKAITPKKTSFFDIVVGKNKFNKNNVITGYYVEYNTAKVVANASFGYADYEEIKPNTLYTVSHSSAQTSFYDASMTYISGHLSSSSSRSFTTPSNAAYFRVSIDLTVLNSFMMAEGDTLGTYEAYTRKETISTSFLPPVSNAGGTLGKLIIVDINGKGNYTTITAAINAANDGDTIYVLPGVYKESIKIRPRNVNIIGFDKELCILKNDDPSYSNPPLDLAKGNISNMTIYAEKLSGAVASGTTPYAVHIDAIESVGNKLTFNNCRLISDWNAGAGIGMQNGFTLTFNDCELLSNDVTNTNGGVFFHDSAVNNGYGIGNIIFNRCIIKSKSDIAIMPSSSGVVTNNNSVYMTFYNTMIYSATNGKTNAAVGVGRPVTGTGWRTYNNFFLNADSYNNNIALFNA